MFTPNPKIQALYVPVPSRFLRSNDSLHDPWNHTLLIWLFAVSIPPGSSTLSTIRLRSRLLIQLGWGLARNSGRHKRPGIWYILSNTNQQKKPLLLALQSYKSLYPYSNIIAILAGTRKSDPHGGESLCHEFQEITPHRTHRVTDLLWPCFIRIHPNLEWTYADV